MNKILSLYDVLFSRKNRNGAYERIKTALQVGLEVHTDYRCLSDTDGHQTKDSNRWTHLLSDC